MRRFATDQSTSIQISRAIDLAIQISIAVELSKFAMGRGDSARSLQFALAAQADLDTLRDAPREVIVLGAITADDWGLEAAEAVLLAEANRD